MAWELTGNSKTSPDNHFVGTTDKQPLVIKTDSQERLRITADGKVGIGTPRPGTKLAIEDPAGLALHLRRDALNEWFFAVPNDSRKLGFRTGSNSNENERVTFLVNGNVGIGTTNPGVKLSIEDSDGLAFHLRRDAHNEWFFAVPKDSNKLGLRVGGNSEGNERVTFLINGNVGIGTPSPNEKFEVHGNILATGDVLLSGADCAEEFDVAEDQKLDPGTVMVIQDEDRLQQCSQAYDKKVAGVLSGAGNYRPGIILDRKQSPNKRMPLALTGKVFVKVDATRAPVEVGDLLTTSATPGFAMKAVDPFKAFGAVFGKALKPLASGKGLIPVLVALH